MKQIKNVQMRAHINARVEIIKPQSGEILTQPDMDIGISEILKRSMLGMEMAGYNPVYYGDKHPELTGFENLDKMEKVAFARSYRKVAENEVEDTKRKIEVFQQNELKDEIEKFIQIKKEN